jgi:acetaldehyde dehydrogenase (acetylating)
VRLLQGPQRDRHVLVGEVIARIVQHIGPQARTDALECVDENLPRLIVFDLVIFELIGRHAAADADIEPAVTEVIDDGDFLDQPQRRVKRQQIDERPQSQALGRARDGADA